MLLFPLELVSGSHASSSSCLSWSRTVIVDQLRSPEQEVVTQQLHDQGGVLVILVLHAVEVGDGLVEGGSGHGAGFLRVLLNFIVEYGMVQSQAELKGVSAREGALSMLRCFRVSCECLLGSCVLLVLSGELGDVTEVVSSHLVEKHLCFVRLRVGHEVVFDERENVFAEASELSLQLLFVDLHLVNIFGISLVVLFLLNG